MADTFFPVFTNALKEAPQLDRTGLSCVGSRNQTVSGSIAMLTWPEACPACVAAYKQPKTVHAVVA